MKSAMQKKTVLGPSRLELNPDLVVETIGWSFERWKGRCSDVARLCLQHRLVPDGSKFCYGQYHGRIADTGIFAGRHFSHHAWIEIPDKRVYDPTRWVFEDCAPYIWFGENLGDYDIGGCMVALDLPFPKYQDADPGRRLKVSPWIRNLVRKVVSEFDQEFISPQQASWLAKKHPSTWGEDAARFYLTLIHAKMEWAIPIDLRKYVLGD